MSPAIDPTRIREDELIVVRCQLGERAAFDELIQRWHEPIWRYVRRQVGEADAAREVAQDVWIRVLRGIGRLRDGAKLRAWLFGIARRALMDRLRQQYASPALDEGDAGDIAADEPDGDVEARLESMHRELALLPLVEREALALFYLEALSLEEVADVQAVPVGTVKSRLFRARKMLRSQMTSRGDLP